MLLPSCQSARRPPRRGGHSIADWDAEVAPRLAQDSPDGLRPAPLPGDPGLSRGFHRVVDHLLGGSVGFERGALGWGEHRHGRLGQARVGRDVDGVLPERGRGAQWSRSQLRTLHPRRSRWQPRSQHRNPPVRRRHRRQEPLSNRGDTTTDQRGINVDTFGVLKLTLHPAGYDWNFVPEAGAPSPTPDPAPAIERRTYRGPLTWQPGRTSWVPCKGLPHAGRCPYSSLVLHAGATRSWWVTRTRSNGGWAHGVGRPSTGSVSRTQPSAGHGWRPSAAGRWSTLRQA